MKLIKASGYSVYIGEKVFDPLKKLIAKGNYSSYFILCDENTMQYCLPALIRSCPVLAESAVIELESGEEAKSVEFSIHIWQTLFENHADKQCLILHLGGGVVSDLGGFAASVYKRGIDFINIPTSLLAMADASVGGKTGINFTGIKNGLGTFNQPRGVFIYPGFLNTLPARHFKNGLAEIFKIALISDASFWEQLKKPVTDKNLEQIIIKSVGLKNAIVMKDPLEKGLRKILNFGHSIGHAIEGLMMEELLHGEAIVAGMIMESHIAFQKKLIGKKLLAEISAIFISNFLTVNTSRISPEAMVELIRQDKKNNGNKLLFALIDGAGSCRFNVIVTEKQILNALEYYKTLIL